MLASDLLPQTTSLISGLGALLTAVTSLVAAVTSSRITRRRMRDDCDKRVAELGRTFRAGLKLADERPKRDDHDERWSHLE